jgi:hypothetical protein
VATVNKKKILIELTEEEIETIDRFLEIIGKKNRIDGIRTMLELLGNIGAKRDSKVLLLSATERGVNILENKNKMLKISKTESRDTRECTVSVEYSDGKTNFDSFIRRGIEL